MMMKSKQFFVLFILLYCVLFLIVKTDANLLNAKINCSNNSSILWDSLEFVNSGNLLKKLKTFAFNANFNKCNEHLDELFINAGNGSSWALKMLDASGKYGGKLFSGNNYWLGSNSLCLKLQHSRTFAKNNKKIINQDYNYRRTFENRLVIDNDIDLYSIPPFDTKFIVLTTILEISDLCQFQNITGNTIYIGLCLPSSCNFFDIKNAFNKITKDYLIKIIDIRNINEENSVWLDPRFYILCILFSTTTILITLGTILDHFSFKNTKYINKKWYKFLNAFSVYKNMKSICLLDVGEDTLSPIHGLKFLSMIWVILVHSCLMLFQVAENKKFRDDIETNILYQTISNGTYSVDTFFTLSGVLVSYLFFRTTSKHSLKTLVGKEGIYGQIYLYIGMLIYRFIRLSFPYIIVFILTGFMTEQKINNSPLTLPNRDNINCNKYWWRNILYVNTFYPVNEMCMIWSWYLSNDTQFFTLGVPLLIIAIRYKIIAFSFMLIYLLSSLVTTAIISYNTEHIIDIRDPFANYDQLYDKPWIRIGPYLIGMITGWVLFRINCRMNIHKSFCHILWLFTLCLMIFIIYGPLYFGNSLGFGVFYSSCSHTLWSIAVSWILVACVTRNGFWIEKILSWRYMYPFSRISYCAYLIHPLIIRMILLSSENAFYLSIETVAALFFGILIITFIFATVLSLAFESPIVSLLRLGHPTQRTT